MTAVSAAYQRARRWRLKPIKLVTVTHQEGGKKVRQRIWRTKAVKEDMRPWITPQDVKKADVTAFLRNNP